MYTDSEFYYCDDVVREVGYFCCYNFGCWYAIFVVVVFDCDDCCCCCDCYGNLVPCNYW